MKEKKSFFLKPFWLIKWHLLNHSKCHCHNTLWFQRSVIYYLPCSFGMRKWIIACMVTKVFNRRPRITKKRELLLHDHTRDKTIIVIMASYELFCMWLWLVGRVMRGIRSSKRRGKWKEEEEEKREFGGWWWWQWHVVCICEKGKAMTLNL